LGEEASLVVCKRLKEKFEEYELKIIRIVLVDFGHARKLGAIGTQEAAGTDVGTHPYSTFDLPTMRRLTRMPSRTPLRKQGVEAPQSISIDGSIHGSLNFAKLP